MDKKKANLLAKLALLIVAILWGSSLTVVKQSSKTFNPNFILAIRFTLAAILLSIIFWKRLRQAKYDDIKNGLLIGIFLFMAYSSQTLGVKFADPGRSGFLSASYCVIVPFLGWIVFKQRPDRYNLSAAALCITGIFFISLSGSSSHVDNPLAWLGDLLALLSGLLFASHIIAVSALARDRDPIVMTILQFIMAAVLSWITTIVVEDNSNLVVTSRSVMELLYLAVKYTNPSTAAIILGFESIFGILIPVLIGIESLTVFSVIGFVFIFAAILVSETKLSFLKKNTITAQ